METDSSESVVQTPVEPAKPKPKKKKKVKSAVKKVKSAKPAAKRHTSKNGAARKVKQAKRPVLRACRMDIRLTAAEREKLTRKAAAMRRTVTSIVAELIEKMK